MIYQVFYDSNSAKCTGARHKFVTPCGVYKSRDLDRIPGCIYDDEKYPNLTDHNTLCEWRVLFYVWKNYPSSWIGFTSWRHDEKCFSPPLQFVDENWLKSNLDRYPIIGFAQRPLRSLLLKGMAEVSGATLKTQFIQWKIVESLAGIQLNDSRSIPLAKYHDIRYWDFVIHEFRRIYGIDIERELDWVSLGAIDRLHTWCNAFVVHWDYFDRYMTMFAPIVFGLLDRFGSHPTDLELAYICERLIILYNYIQYSNNKWAV
jgi:hypothetical protein